MFGVFVLIVGIEWFEAAWHAWHKRCTQQRASEWPKMPRRAEQTDSSRRRLENCVLYRSGRWDWFCSSHGLQPAVRARRLEKIENAILFARFFGHCWLWCWGFLTEHTLIDNITMPKLVWHESQAFALELGVGGALVDVAGLSARTGEEDCHGVMQVRNASEINAKKCMKETWWVCVPMCSKSAWDRSFEDCFVLDFKTGPSPWSSTHLWSEANVCHVNLPWSPVSRRQVPV